VCPWSFDLKMSLEAGSRDILVIPTAVSPSKIPIFEEFCVTVRNRKLFNGFVEVILGRLLPTSEFLSPAHELNIESFAATGLSKRLIGATSLGFYYIDVLAQSHLKSTPPNACAKSTSTPDLIGYSCNLYIHLQQSFVIGISRYSHSCLHYRSNPTTCREKSCQPSPI
jgi:hypothetical protein